MSRDFAVLAVVWVLTIVMLMLAVPKNRLREALVSFTFMQVLTWFLGLSVVQLGLIEYPVRLFAEANRSSFTFEYLVYPSLSVVFNLHYPEGKSRIRQYMYYFCFCTALTGFELIIGRYTLLIKYIHWTWYITWITYFLTFYASRKYFLWFFRKA